MARHDFDAAVREHQSAVFTFASYLLRDRSEAEDATQEVLLKLWRHEHVLRDGNLLGWLMKVTRNACLDRLRSRRSAERVFSRSDLADFEAACTSASPDPEQLAASSEIDYWLRHALSELAEPARSAVILREVQGLAYREICHALGMSLANVKVSLHRARRKLRDRLREVYSDVSAA